MRRPVGIGQQDFEYIRTNNLFYVDKTSFIKEWWGNYDSVTLITRPRRFGKTLTMSMVEKFFSVNYAGRGDLFEGLAVWEDEGLRNLQGSYPVISLSFANIKETDYETTRAKIDRLLIDLYNKNNYLLDSEAFSKEDRSFFESVTVGMPDSVASMAINKLSEYLYRYYGKKVIILLDEYDTPMQESYIHHYWGDLVAFIRSMFNSTFKTNPYMERSIMTGITRVSKESVFSDLNNLVVVTTTSDLYADSFGFTEGEVFSALDEYGLSDRNSEVKRWYDGFTFGDTADIYNPWSIINYLKSKKLDTYWANTSSNSLVGTLIREGDSPIKIQMEDLMNDKTLMTLIDEQLVYSQLNDSDTAIWSLLLSSGYLKINTYHIVDKDNMFDWDQNVQEGDWIYELSLTNLEVKIMFRNMIRGWFQRPDSKYNSFIKALLSADLESMNAYMNQVALSTFSFFDTGKQPTGKSEPERFYHGFVLGLIADLSGRYTVTSNRESGFGRYDVVLEPKRDCDPAIIMEFKVFNPKKEAGLADTVANALDQIEKMKYKALLTAKDIDRSRIHSYGFAFCGKEVLIGDDHGNNTADEY